MHARPTGILSLCIIKYYFRKIELEANILVPKSAAIGWGEDLEGKQTQAKRLQVGTRFWYEILVPKSGTKVWYISFWPSILVLIWAVCAELC